MAWYRIDDKFHSHAKVLAAGNAAIGLYVRCGAWSCDQATEGRIPRHVARSYGTVKEVSALLDARLWVEDGDFYVIPDFLDYNPSNEEVADRRAKRAAAGRAGGIESGKQRRSKAEANASPVASSIVDDCFVRDEANANPHPHPHPHPLTDTSNSSSSKVVALRPADDDRIINGIIDAIATLRTETKRPDNPTSYKAAIVEQIIRDEHPNVAAMLAKSPHLAATPRKAAEWYEANGYGKGRKPA